MAATGAGAPHLGATTWERLERATKELDPPFAVIDLAALDANAADLVRRAAGVPLRVASKSLRCKAILNRVLAMDGFAGVLAYTLGEALWLAQDFDDVVVAYPTTDRGALRALAGDPVLARRVTIMVDAGEHLDLIDAAVGMRGREDVRVCLDLDASLRLGPLHVGARRSPLHSPEQIAALAATVVARPGFRLVGVMAYEAQIAGVGDAPPGRYFRGLSVRQMQAISRRELARRRSEAVAAVRHVAPLEFVNGGGTGSVESTAVESAVTEIAAGSGLYGPTLFDAYRRFQPSPAAFFALPVVRKPAPVMVTVAGGGWIASGPSGPDRAPTPVHPPGLQLVPAEGAGEVQTPLRGAAAASLDVGDTVWFRHAKAGELCEHVAVLHLVDADGSSRPAPTYRGAGKVF